MPTRQDGEPCAGCERLKTEVLTQVCRADTAEKITAEERIAFRAEIERLKDQMERLGREFQREIDARRKELQERAEAAEARALAAEKALAEEEAAHSTTIGERDAAQEAADQLAYTVFTIEEIGEHSNLNDPWANAATLLAEIVAEREQLRTTAERRLRYISECQQLMGTHDAAQVGIERLIQERDQLRADLAEALEALKPFAAHYRRMKSKLGEPDDYSYMAERIKDWFGVSEFERAAASGDK